MLYYTIGQQSAFLFMVYGGLGAGLIYDLFRAMRLLTVAGRWLTAALDCAFLALATLLFGVLLLWANGGDLRLYALLGYSVGFGLYQLGIGWLLRRGCGACVRWLMRACRKMAATALARRVLK